MTTPRCGRCGYPTVGLTTLTCPECGGGLRQVGITLDRGPVRWADYRSWATAAAFTLAVVLTGITTTRIARDLLPPRWSLVQTLVLDPPSSAGAWQFELAAVGTAAEDGTGDDRLPVTVRSVAANRTALGPTLRADFVACRATAVDAAGRRTNLTWPLTPATVVAALAGSGRAVAPAEAAAVCRAVRDLSWSVHPMSGGVYGSESYDGEPFPQSMLAFTCSQRPPPRVGLYGIGLWTAVWVAGLLWFHRPRRAGVRR